MSIIIARNPNTKILSVGIVMPGYFGTDGDGIKLVDQDVVFPIGQVEKIAELPSNVFDSNQKSGKSKGENPFRNPDGTFKEGYNGGSKGPSPMAKTLTEKVREVLSNKYYDKKDGTKVRAFELLAEAIVDNAVLKGNPKIINTVWDRLDGKVTQGIRLGGAIAHGVVNDEEIKRLIALFPEA